MSINFDHTTGNISIAAPASATGKVLSDDGTWISVNPMTASGDMVYGGASGIPTRLAKGTDTQVLTLASGVPTWANASGSGGAAVDMFASLASAENSITGAATAIANRMNVCSGTTADYALTLPTPSAGAVIGIRISPACTKLITVDAGTGKSVNGVDQSKIMWAGESVVLLGVDTNTWVAVATHLIPMYTNLVLNNSNHLFSAGVETKLHFDTVQSSNNTNMVDAANYSIKILRPSNYNIIAFALFNDTNTSSGRFDIELYKGATFYNGITNYRHGSIYLNIALSLSPRLVAGDLMSVYGFFAAGSFTTTTVYTGSGNIFSIRENPAW